MSSAATPPPSAAAHTPGPFGLVITTGGGTIDAPVASFSATMHPDGTADPIDPPHSTAQQWQTAAWITQSAYPSAPATGPSYIYGHACHYHVCAFTMLTYARVGDGITVKTSSHQLSYRICATGLSPKSGNLLLPTCSNGSRDLVLVTCQFERGDTSTHNLVIVATLIAATTRRP